jgi:pyruvate formate lyase activating enzyme
MGSDSFTSKTGLQAGFSSSDCDEITDGLWYNRLGGDTMEIAGLQKLTLLDYPGRLAATVFTRGCNFRCPFCHNASLVPDGSAPVMTEEDFFSFLRERQGLIDGVCVSGGEPLLQPDLDHFLARIKALGFLIKLDTNGSDASKLRALAAAGLLDYVAMDIKNAPEKYAGTAGLQGEVPRDVLESVDFLLGGSVDYEFRTTVVKELHTAEDFAAIGKWIRGAKRYFLQNFEDSGHTLQPGLHSVDREEIEAFAAAVRPWVPAVCIRGR